MVVVFPGPPALDPSILKLYFTRDILLADLPVIVFHGPSTTTNSTLNSSRIQAHVYTLAGFQSFPRLTISPISPLYSAVHHLPSDKQGDEKFRGLAVSLLKYFAEMPKAVKTSLRELAALGRPDGKAPAMFDEMHAGELAANMIEIEKTEEVVRYITSALFEKTVSWADVDVVIPQGSLKMVDLQDPMVFNDSISVDYGKYDQLVKLFGEPTFLPTSKLRRAPSKPTSINRARFLTKDQKESLRREMCELLDTEERYNNKLDDLINSVAKISRQNVSQGLNKSTSQSCHTTKQLFPDCLNRILTVNTSFMKDIRTILAKSENEAIKDMQETADIGLLNENLRISTRVVDPTGTEAFAKSLLNWFPQFFGPYQEYLRASPDFPMTISSLLRDSTSSSSKQIYEIGEQRLRSLLIEPVQRLPRYSLFIDNMVNLLPATHPALARFLKAKDIITDICALDNDRATESSIYMTRLREIISLWPASFIPHGRLITAVDVVELKPPYSAAVGAREGQTHVLLLFSDSLVVVRKADSTVLSARGIIAEIDRPVPTLNVSIPKGNSDPAPSRGLHFALGSNLRDVQFTESENGQLIQVTHIRHSAIEPAVQHTKQNISVVTKVYLLLGSYEGKTTRWSEEVARARVEERFSETFRDSYQWSFRSINASSGGLGVLTAIYEKPLFDHDDSVRGSAAVTVVVDEPTQQIMSSVTEQRDKAIAFITLGESGQYHLALRDNIGTSSTDTGNIHDFAAIFNNRLGHLLRFHNQPHNNESAQVHISFHQVVLESLPIRQYIDEKNPRSFRPISPVKLISNFLGGISSKEANTPSKYRPGGLLTRDVPTMLPPDKIPPKSRSYSKTTEESTQEKVKLVKSNHSDHEDPHSQLEETFTAYIIALRSRSGNVVGKVLRGRANADELLVNELYNTLLENPSRIQSAAEVSIDVLFLAFENFLNRAWKERFGPILAAPVLKAMLSRLASTRPGQAIEQFKVLLSEMTSQNRSAFTTMIKLLSVLLDASGSDGDRGALMATFAEALVVEGNPHDYITMLDRLIEDYEFLFEETPTTGLGLVSDSLQRSRSINTGSLSSNASSLRKRFGFGTLNRENSKTDSDSRAISVWRTLSKNSKSSGDGDSQPSSLSKASLLRSRSIDMNGHKISPIRPPSRDLPSIPTTFSREGSPIRPGSAHNTISSLTTIGEGVPDISAMPPRKKRRSSLSDLKALQGLDSPTSWSSIQPRNLASSNHLVHVSRNSPQTPSPTKQQFMSNFTDGSPQYPISSNVKENLPAKISPQITLAERAVDMKSDEVVITSFSPQKRKATQTGIPSLSKGLSERQSPNSKKLTRSPQRLRIQSPQKLRERLQQEEKAISEVELSFQAELSKIGEEMSTLKLQHQQPLRHDFDQVVSRLATLESRVSTLLTDLTGHTTSIQNNLDSSLVVSERKARSLDELCREANAENEALYERFNEELRKILKGVKGGQGVEEMRAKMKQAQEDAARLKKENQRLKRENLGLRSQLRGE